MSFSSAAKAELCRDKPEKKCCALAESYGVLLYCNSFSAREIRIITASDAFALRLPKLFRRAFGLSFDRLPAEGTAGKKSFGITDEGKLNLTVAVGCTGGRHRSVAIAAALTEYLKAKGISAVNVNRDIDK